MKHSPKNDVRLASVVSVSLVASALALYAFSTYGVVAYMVLRILSACFGAAGIYVAVRFGFTRITYAIVPREGVESSLYGADVSSLPTDMLDFAVLCTRGGRRDVTECLLGLESLCEVSPYRGRGSARELRARYGGIKLCYYTVRMLDCDRLSLVFEEYGEVYAVVAEPCREMRAFLEKSAESNSLRFPETSRYRAKKDN